MRLALSLSLFLLLLAGCDRAGEAREMPAPKRIDCVNDWTRVAVGVEYRMLNCQATQFDLHLVRVDPKRAKIGAVVRPGSTATDLGREFTFAINANFFDEKYRPLGVVMSERRMLNRLHPVTWQSIFYVDENGRPGIVPVKEWERVSERAVAAAQCGPRLVVAGKRNDVARAKPDWRSGVCIDRNRQVVFFVTPQDARFDVTQMVELAFSGMQCRDAMLFDGGPSTQIFLRRDGVPVVVEGDKRVPAYMVVTAGKR